MIFEHTVLRAPWTDFNFPKTVDTYIFRTFDEIHFWGSLCYSETAIYMTQKLHYGLFIIINTV